MPFEPNVGRTDQIVRITGGVVLIGLAVNAALDECILDLYGPLFASLGGIFLGTGVTQKCPLCKVTGIDTLEDVKDEESEEEK